jgi:hypothetical protein
MAAPEIIEADAVSFEALRARRVELAQAFAAQAALCSARRDTDHFSFHGCVDWHSAAHAAWALSAYEAMTGDRKYAAQIEADLTPALVAQEVGYVSARPDFEMPYGRAWFLRLAVERKALRGDDRLDALAALAATSMRAHYESEAPNPNRDRYANASWALINLLHYARATGDADLEAFVAGQVRANFLAPRCDLSREDVGFIAVCTTWAWLVSEVLPEEDFQTWYGEWNPGLETLTPVTLGGRSRPAAAPLRDSRYGRRFSLVE